jgi:hypothetical protein
LPAFLPLLVINFVVEPAQFKAVRVDSLHVGREVELEEAEGKKEGLANVDS